MHGPCSVKTGLYPSPERQILDFSILKEFADDNFKFDESDRKFFSKVEKNYKGKEEIVRCEHSVFERLILQIHKNKGLFGKKVSASAKSIDSGQPAQSAQADLGRYILFIVNFSHAKGSVCFMVNYGSIIKHDFLGSRRSITTPFARRWLRYSFKL